MNNEPPARQLLKWETRNLIAVASVLLYTVGLTLLWSICGPSTSISDGCKVNFLFFLLF